MKLFLIALWAFLKAHPDMLTQRHLSALAGEEREDDDD